MASTMKQADANFGVPAMAQEPARTRRTYAEGYERVSPILCTAHVQGMALTPTPHVTVGAPQEVGATVHGQRRLIPILGGEARGTG